MRDYARLNVESITKFSERVADEASEPGIRMIKEANSAYERLVARTLKGVHPGIAATAMRLADGDVSRIVVLSPTRVEVR
jgi:hypothetical protein